MNGQNNCTIEANFSYDALEPLQIGGTLIVIAAVVSLQTGRKSSARTE